MPPRTTFIHVRRSSPLGRAVTWRPGSCFVLCGSQLPPPARQECEYFERDDPVTRAELRRVFAVTRRPAEDERALPSFFGFERTNFGIIHVRTDGERGLVSGTAAGTSCARRIASPLTAITACALRKT
jgi:hypothetical protein